MGSLIISEGIILIASIIIATGFSVTVLSQMGVFKSTLATASATEKDVALTRIKIIYATNSSDSQVEVWIKNTGSSQIVALDKMDVYFGELSYAQRMIYNNTSSPSWTFDNPSGDVWPAKETIQLTVSYDSALERNVNYMLRVSAPNGVSEDYIFSIS